MFGSVCGISVGCDGVAFPVDFYDGVVLSGFCALICWGDFLWVFIGVVSPDEIGLFFCGDVVEDFSDDGH